MTADVVFDLAWVGAVIAFFLPLLTSFVKRQNWSDQTKRVVALIVAAVVGVVNVGVQEGWEFGADMLSLVVFSIAEVYTVAQVAYQNFWKDTAPERTLAAVGSSNN